MYLTQQKWMNMQEGQKKNGDRRRNTRNMKKNQRAKEEWGQTKEYKEYEEKSTGQSMDTQKKIWQNFMLLFAEFGKMTDKKPESEEVQLQVKKLQDYISEHFYECSKEILNGLGKLYASNGEFTKNIDKAAGSGRKILTKLPETEPLYL